MDELQKAKNHLQAYTDYAGAKGTLDSLMVAQINAAIAQAEAMQRMAVALETLAKVEVEPNDMFEEHQRLKRAMAGMQ